MQITTVLANGWFLLSLALLILFAAALVWQTYKRYQPQIDESGLTTHLWLFTGLIVIGVFVSVVANYAAFATAHDDAVQLVQVQEVRPAFEAARKKDQEATKPQTTYEIRRERVVEEAAKKEEELKKEREVDKKVGEGMSDFRQRILERHEGGDQ